MIFSKKKKKVNEYDIIFFLFFRERDDLLYKSKPSKLFYLSYSIDQ